MQRSELLNRNAAADASESHDIIAKVTASTFDALVVKAVGRVAVEFMSYGCEHCRAIEPLLQQAAAAIEPDEKVYRVNIAVDESLATRYDVQGTPTLIMFLDGREVGRAVGPHPTLPAIVAALTKPFEYANASSQR